MSKWYCPLPFKHAYIDNQGVASCCRIKRKQISLDHWSNDANLLDLQKQTLSGEPPIQCQSCVTEEKTYGRSLRTDSLRDYNYERFETSQIDFIDFRSINICNFKCRSCSPSFSHGIGQEVNHHPRLRHFYPLVQSGKTASVTDDNVQWIKKNLQNLKRIMLTGGEPTVIPGVRELIDIIRQHHQHIQIMITSNASFRDDFWFDITRQLPNLHWTVSIDAVGSRAEIIRHGTDWSVVKHNVEWLAQNAASLDINSVVSNLSVFGLKPLLEFGRHMQQLSISPSGRHGDLGCRHQFYVCRRPYFLAADNWPDHIKPPLLEYLGTCLDLCLDPEQHNMLTGLLNSINNAKFDEKLWQVQDYFNQSLDSIRNENHLLLYEAQQ